MKKMKDKIAIVTGASSGIGQGVSVCLAREGCAVVLNGRNEEALKAIEDGIRAEGGNAHYIVADVTDRSTVDRLIRETLEHFGRIDILVNSAGVNTKKRAIADIALEDWDRVIEVNLTGTFNGVRAVLPQMRKQESGLIINISSMAGVRASVVAGAAYSASKFGVVSLTHSTNQEEGRHGIRACVICPGEVDTPMLDQRPVEVPPERRRRVLRSEDFGDVALFVATMPPRAVVEEIHVYPRAYA